MQTHDYAQAALWDTAPKFSLQSRAMTSPDHLEDRTTLDKSRSSSHFEVGEPDCFVISGQQARQYPVFPQAKHVPMFAR